MDAEKDRGEEVTVFGDLHPSQFFELSSRGGGDGFLLMTDPALFNLAFTRYRILYLSRGERGEDEEKGGEGNDRLINRCPSFLLPTRCGDLESIEMLSFFRFPMLEA